MGPRPGLGLCDVEGVGGATPRLLRVKGGRVLAVAVAMPARPVRDAPVSPSAGAMSFLGGACGRLAILPPSSAAAYVGGSARDAVHGGVPIGVVRAAVVVAAAPQPSR